MLEWVESRFVPAPIEISRNSFTPVTDLSLELSLAHQRANCPQLRPLRKDGKETKPDRLK